MREIFFPSNVATVLLLAATLAGCSPKFNWRQYHATALPFSVLFPDKPQTVTRPVDLNGTQVTMTMTAAEVDGVTFAVGAAEVAEASLAPAALADMKNALVKNIRGTVFDESATEAPRASTRAQGILLDLKARGRSPSGQPLMLEGHFAARGKRVYQVIVLGGESKMSRDTSDMFLGSFRLD